MGETGSEQFGPNGRQRKDDKSEVAERLSQAGDDVQDDTSRSALHSGEFHSGKAVPAQNDAGVTAVGPGLTAAEPAPIDGVAATDPMTLDVPSSAGAVQRPVRGAAQAEHVAQIEATPATETVTQASSAAIQDAGFAARTTDPIAASGPVEGTSFTQASEHNIGEAPNKAPTAISIDSNAVEENADGAVIGTLTAIDPDTADSHSFEVSDDRFEVVGGQLKLRNGVTLDHEEIAAIDVQVTATDETGASFTESFTIQVIDVNEGPIRAELSNGAIAENADGAVVGSLSAIDPDAADSHSFEVSDDRFEVVGSQLKLREGVTLNHEEAAEIDVQVTATDQAGAAITESFTIQVTDVNEGPTSIDVSNTRVAENEIGSIVGDLTALDPDMNDTHSFQVSDDRFEVVDGSLFLRDGVSLDFETDPEISLEITATDAAGQSITQSISIEVQDVNEGPTAVELSSRVIAEAAEGAVVGTLSAIDPDAGDTHSFEVSDDRFEVSEGTLRLKPGISLDHDEASQVDVTVTATDAAGASISESFSIDVVDIPDLSIGYGFHARYFDMDESLRELSDVAWSATPTHQELTTEINYENGRGSFWKDGSTDTFGAQITGSIEVEEGGTFQFHLGGDDGMVLFVNGQQVIEDDGLHSFKTASGEIELEPGTHAIEVRYFENYGHAGLKLEWEGPGIDGRELVAAPDPADAQTVSGMPLSIDLGVAVDDLADGTQLTLEGMPIGTQVSGDGVAGIVDADGQLDLSDWQGGPLDITPPVDFTGPVAAEIVVDVPTPSGGTMTASQKISFDVNAPQAQPATAEMVGRFQANYFDVDHSLRELDDIDWTADPTHQESIQKINYENGHGSFWEGGSTNTFGAQITGSFEVNEGGLYTFFAGGDDGVAVFINGEEVVDNDGLHGFRTRSGEIELEPGVYDLEVRYFENYGRAGLKLEWEGPDTDGRELVQAEPITEIDQNAGLEIGIDLQGASPDAIVELHGLPTDTIVLSGEDSVVADGGPIELVGLDLSTLEISPPPDFVGQISGQIVIEDTAFNGGTVSSSSEFSLTVGDVNVGPDYEMLIVDGITSNADTSGHRSDTTMPPPDETDETDVLNEPTLEPLSFESADVALEPYDKIEW